MCGLAGGCWKDWSPDVETRLSAALTTLRHRGPNDQGYELHRTNQGYVAVGQTRLSVIDLSYGGHQPMLTVDNRFALVFNGEIYNYRELREVLKQSGHSFRSESDTEVLLHAWIEWGEGCLPRLEGMFAFAMHDRQEGTLTICRDAFGIKPLFYEQREGEFMFASEHPALLALRGRALQPNLQRSYDYLVHGDYDSNGNTFVAGVHHLPAGHLLTIELSAREMAEPKRWWKPSIAETSRLSFADAAEQLRELFLHNIRMHLRSDVPLGAALSGGIDSSAVVGAIRKVEPDIPIHTFSYIARGSDVSEEKWVDLVNAQTGAIPHKISADADDLARDLDTLIRAQGEPFGSTSIYAQYRVFLLAKQSGVTVTLDGQGADELLAGYWGYPGHRLLSMWEQRSIGQMHRFARNWGTWPGRSYRRAWMYLGRITLPDGAYRSARKALGRDTTPDWLDANMLIDAGVTLAESRPKLSPEGRGRRVVEQLSYELQQRVLPQLLRHGDRNAMRFSIEGRVPFLTIPMADFLLSLPEDYLISPQGETKRVFRAAMRGIVPDAILDRRDKIGFATPEQEWLRKIAPMARGWLDDAGQIPFLRREPLLTAFDAIIAGQRPFSWQVWRWVNYVRWYSLAGFTG